MLLQFFHEKMVCEGLDCLLNLAMELMRCSFKVLIQGANFGVLEKNNAQISQGHPLPYVCYVRTVSISADSTSTLQCFEIQAAPKPGHQVLLT